MTKQALPGTCRLCGDAFDKTAMTKHIQSCRAKQDSGKKTLPLLHLVAEGIDVPGYWIHLHVDASAKLKDLDQFLRDIWVECCGHMSAFTVGKQRYSVQPMGEFREKGMGAKVADLLRPKMKCGYEYDFGTTTELTVQVISEWDGPLATRPVQLVARNSPPEFPCESCGESATQVCAECLWDNAGFVCDKCAPDHECGDEMLLPVVNSPRMGQCGYDGESDKWGP
jgi:predicted RNA-binding Zn-ribbon protein involved in translation (DUF1610 family)